MTNDRKQKQSGLHGNNGSRGQSDPPEAKKVVYLDNPTDSNRKRDSQPSSEQQPAPNDKQQPSGLSGTSNRRLEEGEKYVPPETQNDVSPQRRLNLDIANRSGHYIFTVGRPSTGKSTMQSHMLRYLFEDEDYVTLLQSPDDSEAEEQKRRDQLLKEWRDCWLNNKLPHRTRSNDHSEFRFQTTPIQRKDSYLTFGFFEVPGEDFERLRRGMRQQPHLIEDLTEFLGNPKCKFVFLLVCIGVNVETDDEIFFEFLEYLRQNFGERYLKESRVAIVISDPNNAAQLLRKHRADRGQTGPLDKAAFVRTFLPQTLNMLQAWKKEYGLAQFYVGDVHSDPEDPEMSYLKNVSFDDARTLFGWIYKNLTGQSPVPGPTIGERVISFLRKFG